MTARIALPALCLAFALPGAFAQTNPPAPDAQPKAEPPKAEQPKPEPKQPARELPPDMKAYNDTAKITDPEKKIEALEKWKKDFPDSAMLEMADSSIFSTLVHKFPEQKDRISKFAANLYRTTPAKRQGSIANNIADQLLNADILLKEAEFYARKSVESMNLATYMQEQVAGYEKRKQKPPAGDELQKRFQESRASRLATLGRVEVKLGHTDKGKKLLEEAYAAIPTNVTVDAALGELAVKAGNDSKALEYLIPARLSGHAPKTANEAFETVYKKTHNGSLDGLETMLDAEYHKRFPSPMHVEAYKPAENRSDRVVLAEVFTGSGCPPCVAADLAFEAAMERYSPKDFVVVMYHQHVPRPDPMTTTETTARAKTYDVSGVPTFVIDGKKASGGGPREYTKQVYDRFDKDIQKDLETPAEGHLTVGASINGKKVSVRTSMTGVKSDSNDLKLQVALVEKELRYTGENGVRFHPMVVRALGGKDGTGFALNKDNPGSISETFDLDEVSKAIKTHLDDYEAKGHRGETFTFSEKKYEINPSNLGVVVFIQDDKTKHVLQAGFVDLSSQPGSHPTEVNGNNQ